MFLYFLIIYLLFIYLFIYLFLFVGKRFFNHEDRNVKRKMQISNLK